MNLIMAMTERMIAGFIERTFKNYVTTIAGIGGISGVYAAQVASFVPDKYRQYVTMGSVLLAGVAAILARDSAAKPPAASSAPSNLNSSARALVAAMLIPLMVFGMAGCTRNEVAQNIVNWTPALRSAVQVVDTSISVLDPSIAPIVAAATVAFDAGSDVVVAEAKAYLANPGATTLAQLQTAIVTFQQQVNTAMLEVAKITNPASQQKVMADVNAVAVVINTMLALVQGVSTKAQIDQMSTMAPVKLATVRQYVAGPAMQQAAQRYGTTQDAFFSREAAYGF